MEQVQKISAKFDRIVVVWYASKKIAIFSSLDLQDKPSAIKVNIQHFKFFAFCISVGIFALKDPDDQIHADPDPHYFPKGL